MTLQRVTMVQSLKRDILERSGVEVPTRFVNCMIYEDLQTFEDLLKVDPKLAIRFPNFGARCVDLLKRIQQSQDPALHQSNQHMLTAVRNQTVDLITRLRQEIPAFNSLHDEEQVWIVTNVRLHDFESFKSAALQSYANGGTPERVLRMAMNEFGFNKG
ncbi:hypothetical protein D3C85_149820 [compost metagenome]|jgi:hypothetical protein